MTGLATVPIDDNYVRHMADTIDQTLSQAFLNPRIDPAREAMQQAVAIALLAERRFRAMGLGHPGRTAVIRSALEIMFQADQEQPAPPDQGKTVIPVGAVDPGVGRALDEITEPGKPAKGRG